MIHGELGQAPLTPPTTLPQAGRSEPAPYADRHGPRTALRSSETHHVCVLDAQGDMLGETGVAVAQPNRTRLGSPSASVTNSLGLVLFLSISPGGIPGREDREEVEKANTIINGDVFRCE